MHTNYCEKEWTMITKERLEELIKQGATIWHIIGKNIFNLNANDVPTFYTLSDENWDVWRYERL